MEQHLTKYLVKLTQFKTNKTNKTLYYLLVHGKIISQQQQFNPNYKSVINPVCSLCGITETLEYIFKNCREIEYYWKMLKEIIASYQIKALALNKILKPERKGISKKNGKKITSLFINYIDITYIKNKM